MWDFLFGWLSFLLVSFTRAGLLGERWTTVPETSRHRAF